MKVTFPQLWLTGSLALGCLFPAGAAWAQIIPDNTLPVNSQVTPGCVVCTINGGTVHGVNLFHSFREFSVSTGGEAWFNNSPAIQAIFSRVTGSNLSNIDGLIKANGSASLFLLNPNGILFGPNARLDIGGTFAASTANSFKFFDGSEFSATNPQAPPLLTINLTPGLQYGASRSGATITSRGNLAAGQNLALVADKLDLQGQVQAGKDLTLQAEDIQIRDSATNPFIASAGGSLLVQGNNTVDIFALNQPQSGFFSGGDLVLRSANPVIGDAHFSSNGSFRVEQLDGTPGDLISPHDPIVLAIGDVTLGTYTGASLHVLAGGSVTLGDVTITGTGTTATTINPANGTLFNGTQSFASLASVTLSDGTVVTIDGSTRATLDVRAGVNWAALGGLPAPVDTDTLNPTLGAATGSSITTGLIDFSATTNGLVLLTNQYQPNPALAAGNITVGTAAGSISMFDFVGGGAGAIAIDSRSAIALNGPVFADSFAGGNGGDVTLLANGNIPISADAFIESFGDLGGRITINTKGTLSIDGINNPTLASVLSLSGGGTTGSKGGDISITAQNLVLTRFGVIQTDTLGQAGSGNITVNVSGLIDSDSTTIRANAQPTSQGASGSLSVTAGSIALKNQSAFTTVAQGSGNAGNLTVVNVNGISLDGKSFIFSKSEGTGGAGELNLTTRSLSALNGSQLGAFTQAAGNAGTATITATDSILLDGVNPTGEFSAILTTVEPGATGKGGNAVITTKSLQITNGAQIRSTTNGPQRAGDITITADTIFASGVGSNGSASAINSQVQATATGDGGNITIETRSLSFTNGALIGASAASTVATSSQGKGGTINIVAKESATFDGVGTGCVGSIDCRTGSFVTTQGAANAGTLNITTPSLSVTNGAQLTTSTRGAGNAGNMAIAAANSIVLTGTDSGLFASSSSSGKGGRIDVTTASLSVTNGAQLKTSTSGSGDAGSLAIAGANSVVLSGTDSGLFASTSSSGKGGRIEVTTQSISVTNGAQVRTSTSGSGDAGSMKITAANTVFLSDPNTGLFASTAPGSTGNGGTIVIDPILVQIQNGARISVDSQGSGLGGSIQIQTDRLSLDQGIISADTASSNGGNIDLQVKDILLLRFASRISTNAGTALAGGNGGNITITTPNGFIVAVPSENSDITANAFTGSGGRVQITAQGIFGTQFRPQLTPESDITASSTFGTNGVVVINTPDIDPSKSLVALPTGLVDASNLVAQNCASGRGAIARKQGEFIVTGRGGLPPAPSSDLNGQAVWQDLRSPDQQATTSPRNSATNAKPVNEPIVEAQGWVVFSDGAVELVAEAPGMPHQTWLASPMCNQPSPRQSSPHN